MDTKEIFYVYLHRRASDNEVFYVGKGCKDRAKSKRGRSEWWGRIVAKHGYTVEYLEKNMSEEAAFDLEKEIIKFYRENGHDLCNISAGGDGPSGLKHSEQAKQDMRELRATPDFIENHLLAVSKPTLCSNGMKFNSVADAGRWLGNASKAETISKCCRREQNSAYGFVWRYINDSKDLQDAMLANLDLNSNFKVRAEPKPKAVLCSNEMVFPSINAAVRWLRENGFNINSTQIAEACKGIRADVKGLKFNFV